MLESWLTQQKTGYTILLLTILVVTKINWFSPIGIGKDHLCTYRELYLSEVYYYVQWVVLNSWGAIILSKNQKICCGDLWATLCMWWMLAGAIHLWEPSSILGRDLLWYYNLYSATSMLFFFLTSWRKEKKHKEHSILGSLFSLCLVLEVGEAIIRVGVMSWFVTDKWKHAAFPFGEDVNKGIWISLRLSNEYQAKVNSKMIWS